MWCRMVSPVLWTRTWPAPRSARLRLDPAACRERALRSSWESCTREFAGNLTCVRTGTPLLPV